MINKRDVKVFDDFESFLPKNFEKDLKRLRSDGEERLKKLEKIV